MSDIEANRVNELAEILPVHVMRLGNLSTGLSLTAWTKISNDILEAATLLRSLDEAQARMKQLEGALEKIAHGEGIYGMQAGEYKAIARAALERAATITKDTP